MNLSLTPATLTPAQELADLCKRVPEFFQLDDPLMTDRATPTGQIRVEYQQLLVDAGLGWEPGGLSIEADQTELQETETTGAAFEAVCRYCIGHSIMMVTSLNANRGPLETACVQLITTGQTLVGCDAYARSMGEAGVLSLSRALRVWGQA